MKCIINRRSLQANTLIIALFTCATLGIIICSFLMVTGGRNKISLRSTAWNSTIPVLEGDRGSLPTCTMTAATRPPMAGFQPISVARPPTPKRAPFQRAVIFTPRFTTQPPARRPFTPLVMCRPRLGEAVHTFPEPLKCSHRSAGWIYQGHFREWPDRSEWRSSGGRVRLADWSLQHEQQSECEWRHRHKLSGKSSSKRPHRPRLWHGYHRAGRNYFHGWRRYW